MSSNIIIHKGSAVETDAAPAMFPGIFTMGAMAPKCRIVLRGAGSQKGDFYFCAFLMSDYFCSA